MPFEESWTVPVKKLNTHEIYRLAVSIHPLVTLEHKDGMTLQAIWIPLLRCELAITSQIVTPESVFSPSIKRAAGAITRAIYGLGIDPDKGIIGGDANLVIEEYKLGRVVQAAKDFETVLSNELPGLATYFVSPKGIYSTDDLISHAELQIPTTLRDAGSLDDKATADIREAGKCLAYEVPTASAFHMWRAVETVMGTYYQYLASGKTFEDDGVTRNWGQYIIALNNKGADNRITTFLDHIRDEYRNPVSHPNEVVDLEEAFSLFGVATSAITQMLKAMQTGLVPLSGLGLALVGGTP